MSQGKKQEEEGSNPAFKDIVLPPLSKFRQRLDGGMDETTHINFAGELTPQEMQRISRLLVDIADEGESIGIVALTRLEFLEPDSCEFRFWTEHRDKTQIWRLTVVNLELVRRIDRVHRIRDVDGNDRGLLKLDRS